MAEPDVAIDSLQDKTEAFLREFFTKGEALVRELIDDNERLRTALVERPGAQVKPRMTGEMLERLMDRLDALEHETVEIRKIASEVQRDTGSYRGRLEELEDEHYRLAVKYVAGTQLHSASSVQDVVQTVTEVLLNFVGAGAFTVYCIDEARRVLFPLMREGGDLARTDEVSLNSTSAVARAATRIEPWKPPASGAASPEPGTLLVLPLTYAGRTVGVVRIEKLLPQKAALDESDYGLLELVSEHGAKGLASAWVRAHSSEVPIDRAQMEALLR